MSLVPLKSEVSNSYPKEAPASLKPRWEYAAKIMRYVQCQMYGAIGTVEELKSMKESLVAPYLIDTRTRMTEKVKAGKTLHLKRHWGYGPYGHKRFYKIAFEANPWPTQKIAPSKSVARTVKGTIPYITLYGNSRTHVSYIIERMSQALYEGGNIIEVFHLGGLIADTINAGMLSSEDMKRMYCGCKNETDHSLAIHVCQSCLGRSICNQMVLNSTDNLVCSDCGSKNDVFTDTYTHGNKPGGTMTLRVKNTLQKDRSIPKKDEASHAKVIMDHLMAKYWHEDNDGTFKDIWSDQKRPEVSVYKGHNPFVASFEGILPVAVIDDKVVYHGHPDQIATTATWINRMKRQHIPAFLGLVGLSQPSLVNGGYPEDDELLNNFDHLCATEQDFKWGSKKNRTSRSKATVLAQMAAWKHPVVTAAKVSAFRIDYMEMFEIGPRYSSWKPSIVKDIQRIVREAQDRWGEGKPVPTAKDGAPWLFVIHHMPANWCWSELWRFFSGKHFRMEFTCNAKWATIDNVTTLSIECVIQFIKRGGRDDFFQLFMTVFIKHALLCSIGHKDHGLQMRTGCLVPNPTSLDDYDETLSNILFETQTSNVAKWDYSQSQCQAILEDARHLHVHTDYYTVPNKCSRLNFSKVGQNRVREIDDDAYESDNELEAADFEDEE